MTNLGELLSAYLARPVSATRSPVDFARHVTGGKYECPPHVKLINEKLVAVLRGEITRLMVSAPPRHGKSWLLSKYFPAWAIGTHPDLRIILTSYESDFAAKWGGAGKALLEEYGPSVFGVRLNPDSSAAARWDILGHEGGMNAIGAHGPVTGKGANVLILEDVIKNDREAFSATQREALWSWFQNVAFTRLEPGAAIIASGTRWHEDDLLGRLLKLEGEQWVHVCLPALAEDDDQLGRLPGEALWPERYSAEDLESIQRTVGSYTWQALYQQSPAPMSGNVIQRRWFRYWRNKENVFPPVMVRSSDGTRLEVHAIELPKLDSGTVRQAISFMGRESVFYRSTGGGVTHSWDLSFKDSATSDYVTGQVWGSRGADHFLLDQVHERMDFPKTIVRMRELRSKWPCNRILVEEKANGAALISVLKHEIPGLIPINPTADKVTRTHAITAMLEAGNVYLPHPHSQPWVQSFIDECVSFPAAKHDDQVDAMTQYLNDQIARTDQGVWGFGRIGY